MKDPTLNMESAINTESPLLETLTPTQREAVVYDGGPLLIIAGAGTGKTTVIARRIAWLIMTERVKSEALLALTFSEKAAREMEERVDLLMPYGYLDIALGTFHAFGDQLMRDHAAKLGLTPHFRVFSSAEQLVFLRRHVFDLSLKRFRPLNDPTRFLEALARFFSRAKDEAVSPEECLAHAQRLRQQAAERPEDEEANAAAEQMGELAECYAAYQELLRKADAVDFGDQVFLAIQLLERHPDILARVQRRFRTILVDEFQDTNVAQFRFLQLLSPPSGSLTVVADDDQSIYKWRGAAISNVLKFLERYTEVHTVVLTDNFRSTQPILDCAYRLIRFNDPDRLEVRQGIDKRLAARTSHPPEEPHVYVFDTVSSEADWVAKTIRQAVETGTRRPNDFAILVRSNREADLFLRALNVAGVPWQFSGSSGLFAREESKMLMACLKSLIDPQDSMSWHHVAGGPLYRCPMTDVTAVSAHAGRTNQSMSSVLRQLDRIPTLAEAVSEEGKGRFSELLSDVARLLELSRTQSTGQVLYRWLADRGFLMELSRTERLEDGARLQIVARFFDHLRSVEELVGGRLPELAEHLELFQAMGNEPVNEEDAWTDCVRVLTIHKAKGLEFPVVFMVGLVQGRFPTPQRRDPIEFPDALVNDLLPSGDYHLQEERRLFYVGMTRAKEQLYLTCSYDYGGKTTRKISQFALEALALATPSPPAKRATAKELLERLETQEPLPLASMASRAPTLRLDPHGIDDYLTCPLKYRYSHLLKIPAMRHHLVVYGAALHKAVELFFTRRLEGQEMGEAELLDIFEQQWSSEGFLTKEHEELRLAQGRETLRRFYAEQQQAPEHPVLIEGRFRFRLGDVVVVGRFDRVDRQGDEAVIIDYKSSEVSEQAAADRRTRESLQLLFYALAWRTLHGRIPVRVELRFLETGVTGRAQFSEEDLERGKTLLLEAARGIRAQQFHAKPQEFTCRWCAFQSICPFAFQPR